MLAPSGFIRSTGCGSAATPGDSSGPGIAERYALMPSPFALVLHTQLPMVVNHGRWPHGSDWLNEATFECYLPLLEIAHHLVADGISPKWTINLSPVLTEQLASPEFQDRKSVE